MNWTKTAMVAACACALAAHGMPSQAELQQAQGVVTEVMRSDVAAFNAGKKKPAEVADAALRYAGEAQGEAARFLLIKGAFYYRMRAGDYDGAMDAIAQMRRDIADVPDKTIADILSGALRRVPRKHCGQLYGLLQRTQNRIRYTQEVKELAAKAKENPSDKAVRTALGEKYALLGDWKAALPELAAGAGPAAKAAVMEQNAKVGDAADAWWALAGTDGSDRSLAYRAHAVRLYRAAVRDGSLAGLKKTLAEKRIAEAKADGFPDEPDEAIRTSPPQHGTASEHRGGGAPAASPATIEKLPKETSPRPQPLVLDLGGGVTMEMVGCPAGKFWMGLGTNDRGGEAQMNNFYFLRRGHVVEITRPFWIGKFPVLVGEWERLMPKVRLPEGVRREENDLRLPIQAISQGTGKWDGVMGLTALSAEEFMSKLTSKFRSKLPRGYVFRLPTEAEWEYALKANSTDLTDPYANWKTPRELVPEYFTLAEESVNYWTKRGFSPNQSARVRGWYIGPYPLSGMKKPNAWGIYDMGGITAEPMLDSWVCTVDEWSGGGGNEQCMAQVVRRHPEIRENGIKDPLLFDAERSGTIRMRWTRQGFNLTHHPIMSRNAAMYWFAYHTGYNPPAFMLRLVVGPDLLKERGITPPKLDK